MSVRKSTVSPTVSVPFATPAVQSSMPEPTPANITADCTTLRTLRLDRNAYSAVVGDWIAVISGLALLVALWIGVE